MGTGGGRNRTDEVFPVDRIHSPTIHPFAHTTHSHANTSWPSQNVQFALLPLVQHNTIFLCYLGYDIYIDDQNRNPNINNRDHQVGQLTTVQWHTTETEVPNRGILHQRGIHLGTIVYHLLDQLKECSKNRSSSNLKDKYNIELLA